MGYRRACSLNVCPQKRCSFLFFQSSNLRTRANRLRHLSAIRIKLLYGTPHIVQNKTSLVSNPLSGLPQPSGPFFIALASALSANGFIFLVELSRAFSLAFSLAFFLAFSDTNYPFLYSLSDCFPFRHITFDAQLYCVDTRISILSRK